MSAVEHGFLRFLHRPRRLRSLWLGGTHGRPTMVIKTIILCAIITLLSGGWCCSQAADPFMLEGDCLKYRLPGRIQLYIGSTLLIVGIVAILCSHIMARVVLIIMSQGMCLAIVLDVVSTSSAFAFYTTLTRDHLDKIMTEQIQEDYGYAPRVTLSWDKMQSHFNCCGINGYDDWKNSKWTRKNSRPSHFPDSCCDDSKCNEAPQKGCGDVTTSSLQQHLWSSFRCGTVCAVVHTSVYLMTRLLERKM